MCVKLTKMAAVAMAGALIWGIVTYPARAASEPRQIGAFGDWSAHTFEDNGHKVCFMSSQPKKDEGKYKKRGEIFAFITHWAGDNAKNVFSVSAGYTYQSGSDVTVKIDDKSFTLFTKGEMAWTKDQDTDNAITEALLKGSKMVIKGKSLRGTPTVDTYSLKGSADAYRAIGAECGMK